MKAVEVEDSRVGHVHRVVHTMVKFQKIVRVFKMEQWECMEVENEDGSREIVGVHQVKGEIDTVAGV